MDERREGYQDPLEEFNLTDLERQFCTPDPEGQEETPTRFQLFDIFPELMDLLNEASAASENSTGDKNLHDAIFGKLEYFLKNDVTRGDLLTVAYYINNFTKAHGDERRIVGLLNFEIFQKHYEKLSVAKTAGFAELNRVRAEKRKAANSAEVKFEDAEDSLPDLQVAPEAETAINIVAKELYGVCLADIESAKKFFKDKMGEKADSVTVSSILRDQRVEKASTALSSLVSNHVNSDTFRQVRSQDNSLATRVAIAAYGDIFHFVPGFKNIDAVDADRSKEIDEFLKTKSSLEEGEVADIIEAAKIMVANAIYKYQQWGSIGQFGQALYTLDKIMALAPETTLQEINFAGLVQEIVLAVAAIEFDLKTKPHYKDARKEMPSMLIFLKKDLVLAAKVQARKIFRDRYEVQS